MKTTKFKPSEVGPIPVEWEVKRLGEIGEPLMCKRILKSQTSDSGEVPFYKIGTFGKLADAYITRELFSSFKRQYSYPQKGDILISAAGTIGRTVEFDGNDAYFQDSNIVWIGHDESVVYNKYLKWCYTGIKWQTEDGGIVTRLYNNNLRNSLIPVPPRPEQEKIAEALSDVDALLAAITKLIEKKRAIKQGAMQQLLTGKKRLAGFTGKWVEKRLGDVADFMTATTPTASIDLRWYIGTENMLADKAGVTQNFASVPYKVVREYIKGDVLTSNIRPYLKKIWLADRNGGCSTDVLVLRTHDRAVCIPEFLVMLVSDDAFFDFAMANAVGTKMPRGDKKVLVNFEVRLPSVPEQQAIASVLSDMDAEIAALEAKRAKYESIKQGMMQELLTGKTRLV